MQINISSSHLLSDDYCRFSSHDLRFETHTTMYTYYQSFLGQQLKRRNATFIRLGGTSIQDLSCVSISIAPKLKVRPLENTIHPFINVITCLVVSIT